MDRQFARARQPMCLLVEVPPVGVLLREVLLVVEEKVSIVSRLLEKKEKIPPGSVILEEERALLFSGVLLGFRYSWYLFSSVDWTGEHRHLCFWSLPMRRCGDTTMRIREYRSNRCKNGIGMDERV